MHPSGPRLSEATREDAAGLATPAHVGGVACVPTQVIRGRRRNVGGNYGANESRCPHSSSAVCTKSRTTARSAPISTVGKLTPMRITMLLCYLSRLPVLRCPWEEPAVVLARRCGLHGLWCSSGGPLHVSLLYTVYWHSASMSRQECPTYKRLPPTARRVRGHWRRVSAKTPSLLWYRSAAAEAHRELLAEFA